MIPCPRCNGSTTLFGTREASILLLEDGRLARKPTKVQKFFCRSCNVTSSAPHRTVSMEAIEAVVSSVLESGVRRTASVLGCDRSVISSVFSDWCDAQEGTLPLTLPDVIGVHIADLGSGKKLLVTDAVEETLIEVLDDHAALIAWLRSRKGMPTLAMVDIDPQSVAILEDAFPDITILVAPASAGEAIVAAAETSLRATTRKEVEKGRNFREDPAMLSIQDDKLTEEQISELSCWSDGARALRRLTVDLLAALSSASAAIFTKVLHQAIAVSKDWSAFDAVSNLLTTWGGRMVAGVSERWVNQPLATVTNLLIGLTEIRSRMRGDIRALLLFSFPERELSRLLTLRQNLDSS